MFRDFTIRMGDLSKNLNKEILQLNKNIETITKNQ